MIYSGRRKGSQHKACLAYFARRILRSRICRAEFAGRRSADPAVCLVFTMSFANIESMSFFGIGVCSRCSINSNETTMYLHMCFVILCT
jgi:hypothetical protein